MKKLGIKQIHNFISTELPERIFEKYRNYEILSEADLQSHVWDLLSKYFAENEEKLGLYKVLNKPYFKEVRIHPDLVIFRRGKPFITIELKEWRKPKQESAKRELQRLINAKQHFNEHHEYKIKRGYLIYLSWYNVGRIIDGPKGNAARFFFEIPIVPENFSTTELKNWKSGFKKWAKYVDKP